MLTKGTIPVAQLEGAEQSDFEGSLPSGVILEEWEPNGAIRVVCNPVSNSVSQNSSN